MEAGTQSALLIIWVLFWMLALSLLTVHPMFRRTRIQIRRSLRLSLQRGRTTRSRMRGRMLRCRGLFKLGLGKTLLWMARGLERRLDCMEKGTTPPLWVRLPMRLVGNTVYFYLFVHVLFRQHITWLNVLAYLAFSEATQPVFAWWKRRKKSGPETISDETPGDKPGCEQRVEP